MSQANDQAIGAFRRAPHTPTAARQAAAALSQAGTGYCDANHTPAASAENNRTKGAERTMRPFYLNMQL